LHPVSLRWSLPIDARALEPWHLHVEHDRCDHSKPSSFRIPVIASQATAPSVPSRRRRPR